MSGVFELVCLSIYPSDSKSRLLSLFVCFCVFMQAPMRANSVIVNWNTQQPKEMQANWARAMESEERNGDQRQRLTETETETWTQRRKLLVCKLSIAFEFLRFQLMDCEFVLLMRERTENWDEISTSKRELCFVANYKTLVGSNRTHASEFTSVFRFHEQAKLIPIQAGCRSKPSS